MLAQPATVVNDVPRNSSRGVPPRSSTDGHGGEPLPLTIDFTLRRLLPVICNGEESDQTLNPDGGTTMGTQGIRNIFQAAAVVGVLAVLCICADVQAQTCTPDFLITSTPNGPQSNRLRAAAAFDVNDVWTVGFANGRRFQTSNYQTLVE